MLGRRARLTVLGWHNVEGTWWFQATPGAGARGMEQQFRALRRLANVVPLGWALRALAEGRALPPRAVAITFDDGYRDNLDIAAPMLRRLGLAATIFLVPGLLSGEVSPWWERLGWAFTNSRAERAEWDGLMLELSDRATRRRSSRLAADRLKRRDRHARDAGVDQLIALLDPLGDYRSRAQFLDWDGARALRATMEIGSHSMYHAILTQETAEAQLKDLRLSREQLASELESDVELFAYPNGGAADYDATTIAAAQHAGYTHAITLRGGVNHASTPPYEIRRCLIYPEHGLKGLAVVPRDILSQTRGR